MDRWYAIWNHTGYLFGISVTAIAILFALGQVIMRDIWRKACRRYSGYWLWERDEGQIRSIVMHIRVSRKSRIPRGHVDLQVQTLYGSHSDYQEFSGVWRNGKLSLRLFGLKGDIAGDWKLESKGDLLQVSTESFVGSLTDELFQRNEAIYCRKAVAHDFFNLISKRRNEIE